MAVRGLRELVAVAGVYGDGEGALRRLTRFALAGAINTAANSALYALGLLAAWVSGIPLDGAGSALLAFASYVAGGLVGYRLGKIWTFPAREAHGLRFAWLVCVLARSTEP